MKKTRRCAAAVAALLAALWLTPQAYGAWQAVNPQWSQEKQQVKPPQWELTAEDIAAEQQGKTVPEGYDYLYVGHGEDSLYGADWNLSEQVGAWRYGTGTAQFQLTDPATGAVITAYCADVDTTSKVGWWYKVENLEDAAYYGTAEAAEHIRAIVLTGYWGTAAGTGSLDGMKATLCAAIDSGALTTMTKEDVAALTEGEALTATQMAVWKYGNPYAVITLGANTLDVGSPYWQYSNKVLKEDYGMDQEDIDEALRRIDAVAHYLMGLSMTKEAAGETTVLRDGELVEEAVLVAERPLGDGQYEGALVFSLQGPLQVGDDLTVTLLTPEGRTLASGRIAPGQSGSLPQDGQGRYTLTGLTLTAEETLQCTLRLTGRQQLHRGVYVYTSEVRQDVSSQTFVGIGEGSTGIHAAQTLSLSFTAPAEPTVPEEPPQPTVPETPQPSTPTNVVPPGYTVPTITVTSPPTGDSIGLWWWLAAVCTGGAALLLRRRVRG